jgi:hypothetical protein
MQNDNKHNDNRHNGIQRNTKIIHDPQHNETQHKGIVLLLSVTNNHLMFSVIMLKFILLSAVAPFKCHGLRHTNKLQPCKVL